MAYELHFGFEMKIIAGSLTSLGRDLRKLGNRGHLWEKINVLEFVMNDNIAMVICGGFDIREKFRVCARKIMTICQTVQKDILQVNSANK